MKKIISMVAFIPKAIKYILIRISRPIGFVFFFLRYRIKNSHNLTTPKYIGGGIKFFSLKSVTVGKYTYGPVEVHMRGEPGEGLAIGNYCSISHDVTFILGGNHAYKTLLTFPLGIHNNVPLAHAKESYNNGKIEVGDDVWIGTGAKIMSGVTIGQGAIVAAYAVVTSSVPPYAIVGGIPAKVIKYRFPADDIEKLVKIDYNKIPASKLLDIYDDISKEGFDVDKVCNLLKVK